MPSARLNRSQEPRRRRRFPAAVVLLVLLAASCAPMHTAAPPSPGPEAKPAPSGSPPADTKPAPPAYPVPPDPAPEAPGSEDPRTLAALSLVERARAYLEADRPDDAIRILERSLRVDPGNPQGAYYLAEAWIAKGVRRQAEAFHRLAAVHLSSDPRWAERLRAQRRRLDRME